MWRLCMLVGLSASCANLTDISALAQSALLECYGGLHLGALGSAPPNNASLPARRLTVTFGDGEGEPLCPPAQLQTGAGGGNPIADP